MPPVQVCRVATVLRPDRVARNRLSPWALFGPTSAGGPAGGPAGGLGGGPPERGRLASARGGRGAGGLGGVWVGCKPRPPVVVAQRSQTVTHWDCHGAPPPTDRHNRTEPGPQPAHGLQGAARGHADPARGETARTGLPIGAGDVRSGKQTATRKSRVRQGRINTARITARRDQHGAHCGAAGSTRRALRCGGINTARIAPWLAPRLPGFVDRDPGEAIRIVWSVWNDPADKDACNPDIQYGTSNWPDQKNQRLTRQAITPLCAPGLPARLPPGVPGDLRHHRLLHVPGYRSGWGIWLDAAGAGRVHPGQGVQLDTSLVGFGVAFGGAMQGGGVALGRTSLAAGARAAGHLIAPFALQVSIDAAFHLLAPLDSPAQPGTSRCRTIHRPGAGHGRAGRCRIVRACCLTSGPLMPRDQPVRGADARQG